MGGGCSTPPARGWPEGSAAAVVAAALAQVPDRWLEGEPSFATPDDHRAAYARHLERRLAAAAIFEEEARRARDLLV